jgi:ATP-binding cassette, subfamily B, bacterial
MNKTKLRSLTNNTKELAYAGWQALALAWRIRARLVIGYIAGGVIETASTLLALYATAKIGGILAGYITTGQANNIWLWVGVDIAGAIGIAIGFWMMQYFERLQYFAMNAHIIKNFYHMLSSVDIADYHDPEIRDNINKAATGYEWQIPNLAYFMTLLIYSTVRLVAIIGVVSQINWWITIIIIASLLPTLYSRALLAQISWNVWGDKGDNRHVFAKVNDMISRPNQQMEMRSMQSSKYVIDKITRINEEFFGTQERKFKRCSRFSLFASILSASGVAVGAIVVLRQFLSGVINLETYFFLTGALTRVTGAVSSVFGVLSDMQDGLQFGRNYFQITQRQPQIADKPGSVEADRKLVPHIEFRDVTFTYPGQSKPVFENFSITIEPGQHIALVGENGAGKSTFIKLLMRFYVPDTGEILVNGHNLNDTAIDSWYSQLATLF